MLLRLRLLALSPLLLRPPLPPRLWRPHYRLPQPSIPLLHSQRCRHTWQPQQLQLQQAAVIQPQ